MAAPRGVMVQPAKGFSASREVGSGRQLAVTTDTAGSR